MRWKALRLLQILDVEGTNDSQTGVQVHIEEKKAISDDQGSKSGSDAEVSDTSEVAAAMRWWRSE